MITSWRYLLSKQTERGEAYLVLFKNRADIRDISLREFIKNDISVGKLILMNFFNICK